MDINFNIEELYESDGTPIDVKTAMKNSIVEEISTRVLRDLGEPSLSLKQSAEKMIKENIHTFTAMGIERFIQQRCTTINDIIDSKINEAFKVALWNDDGLPELIRGKIEDLIEKKSQNIESAITKMFENNFKVILEEILETAFQRFVETAGINTVWVSGKKRK